MQNKYYYRFIITLLMIWPLFTGCYSYLSSSGIPFHQNQEPDYFENLINGVNMANLTYRLAENDDLTVKSFDSKCENGKLKPEGADKADRDEALAAPLLLKFVWLSDVHITQREIKLGSKLFSHAMDEVASTTEFNIAQEDFNWAVYFSLIAAINALHRENPEEPVDFMINTGDSVNTGSIEELYQFIYISNKLKIPWLNAVGNHDITIFGNYKKRLGYGHDPNVNFYPIGDLGNFVWMHRSKDESKISGYGRHLLPVPAKCKHDPSISTWPDKKLAPTFLHGFDLKLGQACSDKPTNNVFDDSFYNSDYIGDYATDLCGISIPVRLIVLNSARKDAFGSEGSIDDHQYKWLKEKLLPKDEGINLVFFHHRPTGYAFNKAKTLLKNGGGTSVVFTGHAHNYDVTYYPGKNGLGFYELNTGSIMEFPQIGRLIELRGEPGGRVWLIARALWSNLMTDLKKDMPPEQERKGIIDICTKKSTKPEDREALQKNINEAVRCGHYGAYDDYLANKRRFFFWSRPQAFEKIWKNANMIIEIKPQKPSE